jgi:hypothetical protein
LFSLNLQFCFYIIIKKTFLSSLYFSRIQKQATRDSTLTHNSKKKLNIMSDPACLLSQEEFVSYCVNIWKTRNMNNNRRQECYQRPGQTYLRTKDEEYWKQHYFRLWMLLQPNHPFIKTWQDYTNDHKSPEDNEESIHDYGRVPLDYVAFHDRPWVTQCRIGNDDSKPSLVRLIYDYKTNKWNPSHILCHKPQEEQECEIRSQWLNSHFQSKENKVNENALEDVLLSSILFHPESHKPTPFAFAWKRIDENHCSRYKKQIVPKNPKDAQDFHLKNDKAKRRIMDDLRKSNPAPNNKCQIITCACPGGTTYVFQQKDEHSQVLPVCSEVGFGFRNTTYYMIIHIGKIKQAYNEYYNDPSDEEDNLLTYRSDQDSD